MLRRPCRPRRRHNSSPSPPLQPQVIVASCAAPEVTFCRLPLPLSPDVVPQLEAPSCRLQLRRVVFISVVPTSPNSGLDVIRTDRTLHKTHYS
ncbi:hypothetical protein PIB30_038111 [Stylosanthes scabra]|uniref:Uncharacterized protein n=1 Tax=Stylosanthes scabra TaxID=79078 RepID=A0ABU6SE60_9FABA|nr:hypothetical protein [Stylosanthes scabra]